LSKARNSASTKKNTADTSQKSIGGAVFTMYDRLFFDEFLHHCRACISAEFNKI
jgi:hypothetical protein